MKTLFQQEIVVERPRLEVFEFAVDLERAPLWNPTVLKAEWLTPGPVAPGHRFREWRHMDGESQTGDIEVRAHRRPELHELGAGFAGVDVRFRFFFDEVADHTRVRLHALMKTRWFARPLARTVGDQLKSLDEDILERLKVAIEIP